MRRPYLRAAFAAVVVLVLAGLYGLGRSSHPQAASRQTARTAGVPVATAVRACAAPGSAGPTAGSVALAAVPGSASAGSAVVTRLTPGGSPGVGPVVTTVSKPGVLQLTTVAAAPPLAKDLQASQPGSSAYVSTSAARGGVLVTASGALAQGLEVEQTGTGGLTSAQCGAPGTSFWFAGPGQKSAATIELYLTNTGSQPADAQVTALTDSAKSPSLLGNADNGITVPPHGMVIQSLGKLIASSKVMALNVSTTVGQVVAAVRETQSAAQAGIWLPATLPPATHLVIPGLPQAGGTRSLYIAVPGSASAQVKITAVTARGSYQPTGGTGIDLLGGSASTIPLASLGGVAGAVSISASAPVIAAMLVPGGPAGSPGGTVAASGGQVLEQGVLAANPTGSAGSTQVVLSAPAKAATVRITTATADTPAAGEAGKLVQVGAKSSVVVAVSPPAGAKVSQFAIVVTPQDGSGPVYAGQVISSGGSVRSVLPVPSSLTWVPLPGVTESLSAVVGG